MPYDHGLWGGLHGPDLGAPTPHLHGTLHYGVASALYRRDGRDPSERAVLSRVLCYENPLIGSMYPSIVEPV